MQISSAAILLFGKNPQLYFPRARVRFIRYEGTEEHFPYCMEHQAQELLHCRQVNSQKAGR